MPVRSGDEIMLLPVRLIESLEADGELVRLTTARGERHTAPGPLTSLEARLDPEGFMRISRAAIVNLETIARIRVGARGTLSVVLASGAEIPISRSQAPAVRDRLVSL
jgi:DNA-binding LytR/AlgR family response regulator